MLSNQCKQNSLLFYATVCHHSVLPQIRCGIVREGKEKNIFFKVGESPAVSRNLKKDQRTLSEKVRKRLMLNGKFFNSLCPISAIFTCCNIQVTIILR